MHTFRLAALAVAFVPLAAASALAQEPAAPAAPAPADSAAPPPAPALALDSLDPSRLTEGRWTYVSTVTRRGASMELGRRSLVVARVSDGGEPALALVDETLGPGGTIRDSVFVSTTAFRARRQHAVAGPVTMRLVFGADSVTGTVEVPGAPAAEVALASAAPPLAGAGMFESVLGLVPLGEGWRASVPQLMVTPVGAAVERVTLAVVGREYASVPAGIFESWVVDVAASGGVAQRFWVDVASGRVVLVRNAAPGGGSDVLYETALVGEG